MAVATLLLLLVTLLPALGLTAHQDSGIVNGKEAKPHSKPYMVSVQAKEAHQCGGFLVSENFVMTAAHCYTWGVKLTVVVGAHDLTRQESSAHRINVKYYHIHPGYEPKTHKNDIMLLQLEKAIPKSQDVKPIPLPKKDKDTKAKSVCNVAGWGATTTKGPASARLLEANVTVVDRNTCLKSWKSPKDLPPSTICTGGNKADNKGICKGDSGGPLVCKGTAVGVASFHKKGNCDQPEAPNVYTNVAKCLVWIKGIMGRK